MDYGLRISKDGIDVKTGADKDMVLTSKYPTLKGCISGGGTQSFSSSETPTTITITHNLGYIPFATIRFYSADYGWWWLTPIGFDGALGHLYVHGYCDATNLYVIVDWLYDGNPSISLSYKYFIYLDKGKL